MNFKISKIILVAYIGLLLASLLAFHSLPDAQTDVIDTENRFLFAEVDEQLSRGQDPTSVQWILLADQWSFQLPGKEVVITTPEPREAGRAGYITLNAMVFLDRNEQLSNEIKIQEFTVETFLTEKVTNHQINLVGGQLQITREPTELSLYTFLHDFTVTQFRPDLKRDPGLIPNLARDQRVLYIQVPQDVQVEIDERAIGNYLWLNEEDQ